MKVFINEDYTQWIDFPIVLGEMDLTQYEEFKAADRRYRDFAKDDTLDPEQRDAEVRLYMIEALSYVCTGHLDELPETFVGEAIEKLLEEGFRIGLKDLGTELSIFRLYVHIINTIEQYVPTENIMKYSILWDGERYFAEPRKTYRMLTKKSYTAGEAVEVLELHRRYGDMIKKTGDLDGNYHLNLGAREIAVLFRKRNEKLPLRKGERRQFLNKRAKLFAKLPMDVVTNVRFFLLNILNRFAKIEIMHFSLKARNRLLSGKKRPKQSGKRKRKHNTRSR